MVMRRIGNWLLQVQGIPSGHQVPARLSDVIRVQRHIGIGHYGRHCGGALLDTYCSSRDRRVVIRARRCSCFTPHPEPYKLIQDGKSGSFYDLCRHGYREAILRVGLVMKEWGLYAVAGRWSCRRYSGEDIVEMALEDKFPRAMEEEMPSAERPCVCKGVRHMPRCEWCERPWAPTLADPGPYHCPVAEFGTCATFADRRSYILLHDGGYPVDALFAAIELAGEPA
jgi:hypothetical protein